MRFSSAALFLAYACVFAALAWWSWRKWPDPLIDFGRELYLPWQITRGRVLYRDIASLFGPLSPYVNALWFRLFGVSLMTIALANMAIFAFLLAAIHSLIRRCTDRLTASTATFATLLLFGFTQYLPSGNYNFVTPYSHEATHGLTTSVAMLLCLQLAIATRRAFLWVFAGACFGLTALTKPELTIAAAAAVAAAVIGATRLEKADGRHLAWNIALFTLAAALPALLFFAYFMSRMTAVDALHVVSGAWTTAFGGIATSAFYREWMAIDRPGLGVWRMAEAFAGFVLFIASGITLCWSPPNSSRIADRLRRGGRLALLVVAILGVKWGLFPRALPLIAVTAVIAFVMLLRQAGHDREQRLRFVSLLTWSCFALVLLGKLGLNARLPHYGFYLALPATVATIVLTCWLVPYAMERRNTAAAAAAFRRIAVWTVAAAIAPYLGLSHGWYRNKVIPIGSGGDRFLASQTDELWQGSVVRDALRQLQPAIAPGMTLAVLPEGVMMNYLLRRDSPLRVLNIMPPELLAFGEDEVLHSLEMAPPDFVVLVHKDVAEYGYAPFGSDPRYAARVVAWVNSHYHSISIIGRNPMTTSGFGLEIRRRN